jgi:predicted RNase H-like HicB family nuclease
MTHYIGILDGAGDIWGVRFPDLPGCHGGGATAELAISDAACAARAWAEHRRTKGGKLPPPRSLGQISEAGEMAAGDVAVRIPVLLDSGRTVRANLSLDAALLAAIDEAAQSRGLTRSAFVASAARDKIIAEV